MVSHHFKFKSTAAQRGSEREGGRRGARGRNKEWLRERERKQGGEEEGHGSEKREREGGRTGEGKGESESR